MIAPLGAGELDVGAGTVSAGLYNAVERGIHLRVVADKGSVTDKLEYSTLLVRKDLVDSGRYKSLADLKGMTIAAAAKGTGNEASLNEALKKGGLKFDDVNVVYMGFPEMLVALRNKGIDAATTNEPTITRAAKEGLAVRASKDVIYPGQQTAVVLYSEQFAQQRRPVAQKFMNAYIRALRDYNDALHDGKLAGPNADDIISILTEYTNIKERNTYAEMTPFAVNPNGHVNAASLANDLVFFKERGLVSGKVSVDDVIDSSFADEAVKTLGAYKARELTSILSAFAGKRANQIGTAIASKALSQLIRSTRFCTMRKLAPSRRSRWRWRPAKTRCCVVAVFDHDDGRADHIFALGVVGLLDRRCCRRDARCATAASARGCADVPADRSASSSGRGRRRTARPGRTGSAGPAPPAPNRCRRRRTAPSSRESAARRAAALRG